MFGKFHICGSLKRKLFQIFVNLIQIELNAFAILYVAVQLHYKISIHSWTDYSKKNTAMETDLQETDLFDEILW